ncbi:MAG: ATP-grasp domain-containing protein [Archaeoglobales archaeon]|nr:ATP-grasp domain-containing protein [Archaeoglobales archaeon]
MSEKIVLVGNNVRNVAESARKAGYKVVAVTKYDDADLELYCDEVFLFNSQKDAEKIANDVAQKYNAKVALCSGCELLKVKADLISNEPRKVERIVDKLKFYKTLENTGIPYPELLSDATNEKAILKPRFGGGGENIEFSYIKKEGFILQRYIEGIPCSVSLIVGKEIVPIASNLILSGWKEVYSSGFRYSGNVTPFLNNAVEEMEKIAIETVAIFDLVGSIGVDFVLADKPYVLEINPRFQGSLDSVEWCCDVNVFELHMKSLENQRIERPKYKRFAARAILFAPCDIKINASPFGNAFFADVPKLGCRYQKGEPVVSLLASGYDWKEKIIERRDLFLNSFTAFV